MTEKQTPLHEAVERALDVFVYAPIGFIFEGSEVLPQLVEKGRNQVTMAKMVGQFAVQTGQSEAAKRVEAGREQLLDLLGSLGGTATPPRSAATTGRPSGNGATPPAPTPARKPTTDVDVAALAITDYDSLSASQVVTRLAGMSADELEAVRSYEAANRSRKTILNKIAQLQG